MNKKRNCIEVTIEAENAEALGKKIEVHKRAFFGDKYVEAEVLSETKAILKIHPGGAKELRR